MVNQLGTHLFGVKKFKLLKSGLKKEQNEENENIRTPTKKLSFFINTTSIKFLT